VRPLIETGRKAIEAYLDEIGQPWRTDTTNLDIRFARNRLRHVVLPGLATEFNPRLTDTLSRTIDILNAESDWIDQIAKDWLATRTSWDDSALVVDIAGLNSEPTALVRRILRASLKQAGSHLLDTGFDHLEQIRSLLESGKSGRVIELPGSIRVERNFDTLVFLPAETEFPDYEYELPIPGRVHIREIGADFEARIASPKTGKPNKDKVLVDGESVGRCVKIRNWKNGDFYSPIGLPASKLKTLFQKERIPRRKRRQWPVIIAESSIVWVASFPVSRDFVPTDGSGRIIEFETSRSEGMK